MQSITINTPKFQNLTQSLLVKLATPGEEPKMASNWPGDVYVLPMKCGWQGAGGPNAHPNFVGIQKIGQKQKETIHNCLHSLQIFVHSVASAERYGPFKETFKDNTFLNQHLIGH